jgi:hypothetical protein
VTRGDRGPVPGSTEGLHACAFGATIGNHVSARDVQLPPGPFREGTSQPALRPLGRNQRNVIEGAAA